MVMPISYPNRCIKDIFGYCKAHGIEGVEVQVDKETPAYHGSAGNCNNNPLDCKFYVTNTVANPYRPELEHSKLVVTKIPPETPPNKPAAKKTRKAKQPTLVE